MIQWIAEAIVCLLAGAGVAFIAERLTYPYRIALYIIAILSLLIMTGAVTIDTTVTLPRLLR